MNRQYAVFVVMICAALLLSPSALAAGEPYVDDGKIVATLVVGADAPATDVLLSAEIASYLQTFATETAIGLGKTTDQVDLDDGILILVGLPQNNPFVTEVLGNVDIDGPLIYTDGDITVISGGSTSELNAAAAAFRNGARELGGVDESQETEIEIETEVEAETEVEVESQNDFEFEESQQEEQTPTQTQPQIEQRCPPENFCRSGAVYFRDEFCNEDPVQYCDRGCTDGSCNKGFFARVFGWFAFWN